jgi:hypothetical protein
MLCAGHKCSIKVDTASVPVVAAVTKGKRTHEQLARRRGNTRGM